MIWGRGIRVDAAGEIITEAWIQPPDTDFATALQTSLGILQPSVFFRRSVFETVGGLSEDWPLQLDYEYWIRIAQAGFKFGFLDRVMSHAVVHADAKSTAQRMEQLDECLRLVREKFQYAPIEWIRRYGEFYLTRKDHKITKGLKLNATQRDDLPAIESRLLSDLNTDAATLALLKQQRDSPPYSSTYRAMDDYGLLRRRPSRIVVTSFDSAYYQQGLNLIAGLHRTSFESIDNIFVYSLGLTEYERRRLESLDKVDVIDYPEAATDHFAEYLDPKTRAYKSYAISGPLPNVADGDLVLWMDAGLTPLKDVNEIFEMLEQDEFFITNHDDKRSWPFYNINFAHRGSHEPLQLSNSELLAPHLCSALVGYRRGGKFQPLVDEAYLLGQIRDAIVWPKVPAAGEKYKPELSPEDLRLKADLISGAIDPDAFDYDRLVSIFDYYGHRTQVIYSILAHRHSAPVSSAKTFRRSNDASSRAAVQNWLSTAFETDRANSRHNLTDLDEDVVIYHHRGTYNNLDGLRHVMADDPLFVVGNGPSLREFDFASLRDRHWLGMNAAYRYWHKAGIYPTYYACFDEVVLDSHREEILRLIERREDNQISRFFLRANILEHYAKLKDNPDVYFLEDLIRDSSWFGEQLITTGSFSVPVGLFLGYREILLLGIDLNYVERLPEAVEDGRALKLESEPVSNPNYFFDDYQRSGDRYNPPNRAPGLHTRSWEAIASRLRGFPVRIRNLNPDSAVTAFEFDDYQSVVRQIDRKRDTERAADQAVRNRQETAYWRMSLLEDLVQARENRQTAPTATPRTSSNADDRPKPSRSRRPNPMRRFATEIAQLFRWYASPSGALFGTAVILSALALTLSTGGTSLAIMSLVLAAVFVPYRFNREQRRSDDQLTILRTELSHQASEHRALQSSVESFRAEQSSSLNETDRKVTAVSEVVERLNQTTQDQRENLEALRAEIRAAKSAVDQKTGDTSQRIDSLQSVTKHLEEAILSERRERINSLPHAIHELTTSWSPEWLNGGQQATHPRGHRGPDVLKGKRVIFCASSGRTGTHYLAELLGSCERVHAVDEAPPYMIGHHLNRVMREPPSDSYEHRRIKAAAIRSVLAGLPRGSVYAETNHMFIKTFHDVVINEFPPDAVSVILLRRSLDRVLKSILELGYFTAANSHWQLWMHQPVGTNLLAKPPRNIEELDDTDRAIGYLFDIEARLQNFRISYPGINTVDVWLEDIQESDGAHALLNRLGLKTTATTQVVAGRPTNQRTASRVAEISLAECRQRILRYHHLCIESGTWTPDLSSRLLEA